MPILRDPSSPTGLSRLAGAPVARPSDLPDHRVEIHEFVDGDAAAAFVAGLGIAANPNRIAWTWEPGDAEANRTVLVARLDEPRPDGAGVDDCLPRIVHARSGHDSRAHREAMARVYAERDADDRRAADRLAPLRAALADVGIRPTGNVAGMSGADWIRLGEALLRVVPGGVEAEFHDREDHGDVPEVVDRCRFLAAEAGFVRAEGRGNYGGGPYPGPVEAVAALGAFKALIPRFEAIRREVLHAAFMAEMKVTPARRRFLRGAAETGISFWVSRNNPQARAGGEEIKASEINRLKSAGWIRAVGRGLEITPAGMAAAGIAEPAAVPPGP